MMITSFVKIAVVLSIVRSALGTQQNPPTQVITGLAIILTVYVMAPLGVEIYGNVGPLLKEWSNISPPTPGKNNLLDPRMVSLVERITRGASEPVKRFLRQHSHLKERDMFYSIALQLQRAQESKQQKDSNRGQQPPTPHRIGPDDFLILIPSFVISELKEAFQIGFLIFLPFIIVDMVVANILLALGMHMLSPTTISLPFKLLLFVLVDGWYLITKGLVVGYL
jgi:type III secretion protein R